MYEKLTKDVLELKFSKDKNEKLHEFSVNKTRFICSSNGLLFRQMKTGYWKEIQNTSRDISQLREFLYANLMQEIRKEDRKVG